MSSTTQTDFPRTASRDPRSNQSLGVYRERATQCVQSFADENPIVFTMIGFATGLVLGTMVGRSLGNADFLRHQQQTAMQRWLSAMENAVPEKIRERITG